MKKLHLSPIAAPVLGALILSAQPALADNLASDLGADLDLDDEFITGLQEPTALAFLPDGRMVITQRRGNVMLAPADGGEAEVAGSITVSTSFQEKGLLGVAVHPDYATNHIIFLYYTGTGGGSDDNRVVSMELGEDGTLDIASEKRFVEGIAAPLNHDGGGLAIHGNYLYIGTGDTGNNSNQVPYAKTVTNYNGTCLTNLNGKVLRLNLDGTIPADNPLVGQTVTACGNSVSTKPTGTGPAREEIFAWGFRNAFRLYADPPTGNIWVGHVGEVTFEMIHVVPPTGNIHAGWPFQEGGVGFPDEECTTITPNVGNCVKPVYSCEQSDNQRSALPNVAPCTDWDNCDNPDIPNECDSMTGGVILNGCEWPASVRGHYVFGDYSSKNIWTLEVNDGHDNVIGERVSFATLQGGGPAAFVEHEGALYIVAHSGQQGHISKVTPKMSSADCGMSTDETSGSTSDGTGTSDTGSTSGEPVSTDDGTTSAATTDNETEPTTTSSITTTGNASSTAGVSPTTTNTGGTTNTGATSAPNTNTGGITTSNTGGNAGSDTGTNATQSGEAGASDNGCACEVKSAPTSNFASFGLLGLGLALIGRRRIGRQRVAR